MLGYECDAESLGYECDAGTTMLGYECASASPPLGVRTIVRVHLTIVLRPSRPASGATIVRVHLTILLRPSRPASGATIVLSVATLSVRARSGDGWAAGREDRLASLWWAATRIVAFGRRRGSSRPAADEDRLRPMKIGLPPRASPDEDRRVRRPTSPSAPDEDRSSAEGVRPPEGFARRHAKRTRRSLSLLPGPPGCRSCRGGAASAAAPPPAPAMRPGRPRQPARRRRLPVPGSWPRPPARPAH